MVMLGRVCECTVQMASHLTRLPPLLLQLPVREELHQWDATRAVERTGEPDSHVSASLRHRVHGPG